MSADVNGSSAEPRPTAAADVSFFSSSDARRQGEGSSLAGSRGSGERWSEKGERFKERFLTPDRRSEEGSDGENRSEKKRTSRFRKSGGGGGFLRDSVFGNGSVTSTEREKDRNKEGKRKVEHGTLQTENKRLAGSRLSGDSSIRSSPLSQELSIGQAAHDGAQDRPPTSRPTTMDPAQLVQMALSLSESRKRHASGSLPVPMATPRSRNVSGANDKYGTVRTRGSDRSRLSPHINNPSPASSSRSRGRQSTPSANAIDDNVLYTFSPATLARAEKTRKYFELASEHRRLLENLPPLKPDAEANANYTFESRSSPGYAQPDIRRVRSNTVSRQELGRQYNPLQILRNRRLRNRERRPFTIPPENFQDTQHVADWMEDVEHAARLPAYRSGEDVVHLPRFSEEVEDVDGENGAWKGHRRTGTAGSVIARPENEWTIDPTERLADTYWTEQGDNKTLIENRRRQVIFPARTKPRINEPRKSDELTRKEQNEPPMEVMEEESQAEEAPRRHRHMLSIHKADRTRHNRLSRLGRSASTSSESSNDGRKPRPSARDNGSPAGLAPLNKHMEAIIAREQRGEVPSPELDSPDHWDSKNTPFPTRPGQQQGSLHRANDSLSAASTAAAQRSKSADGRLAQLAEIERNRFSFDSSPPLSPAVNDFMPSLAMDLSPPSKRTAPSVKKSKHRILPKFRSKSKDRSTVEGRDFAFPSDSDRSRGPSGNAIDPTRLSAEYPRPTGLHRHQTSDSIHSGLHRRGTSHTHTTTDGSIKEPGSTVGRFFKGGRLAELVRTDRKGRKDKEGSVTDASAMHSDASDTENSADLPSLTNGTPNDSEPSPRTSIDRTRSKKGLHTANLPTFKSAAGREKSSTSRLTPVVSHDGEDDHISRQAAARGADRSPRIDRLLPPRINLPDDTDYASTADMPSQASEVVFAEPNRKSYGFLSPKLGATSAPGSNVSFNTSQPGRKNGNYPVTGLSGLRADGGKRHWSISDRGMRSQQRPDILKNHRASPRDLARARALLLASGIKAHNLVVRANNPPPKPPRFLAAAAKTATLDTTPSIPLKETHLRASALLSSHLDKSLDNLSSARQSYQSSTSRALHTRLADLKSLVADKLTHTVQNSSDEADAFGVRLTTEQTLRIKQVDDAVDDILRMRRRQFRLMKKAGFKILEWLVLSIMWWVWFVVVCWKTVKRLPVAFAKMIRWLLWF